MNPVLTDTPAPPTAVSADNDSMLARVASADPRWLAAGTVLVASAVALAIAVHAGVVGVAAVPAVLRTGVAGLALFAVCGYAPARVLVDGELSAQRALLALPLGAALSSLGLAVLGLLHVPFSAALAIVIAAAVLAAGLAHRPILQTPPLSLQRAPAVRIALPFVLCALVGAISLTPIFRSGFATIPGENGDAVLVAGSAVLVEHAPPTATRLNLPINRIPLQWRSKYPIYYALAAISTLAGEDPIRAFAAVSALVLALTAIGFFLFARYVLRARTWLALLALFLLPLDRIVMYVTIHPYYNELWGQFTLPFILLTGWHFLTSPSRRSLGLFAVFLVLGLLAYPLMLPFPLFFLAPGAFWLARRARREGESTAWIRSLRLPRLSKRPWLLVPIVLLTIPVALVLVRGFFEKTLSALAVLAPWTSLAGWHGTALPYLPWPRFVGMPGAGVADYVGLAIICVLAACALRRIREGAGWPLLWMVLVTAIVAIYFRARGEGELFFFKDLAFLGPFVLLLALLELAALASAAARHRALIGIGGIAAAMLVVPAGGAHEIDWTYENATKSILELHGWDRALPRGTSVRIDVPPSGYQLWTTYMFNDHRLSSLDPLAGFFPHPAIGRKADYVIAAVLQPRPADAIGAPLFRNAQFALWRMNPGVPGPDVSSRVLQDISGITTGF